MLRQRSLTGSPCRAASDRFIKRTAAAPSVVRELVATVVTPPLTRASFSSANTWHSRGRSNTAIYLTGTTGDEFRVEVASGLLTKGLRRKALRHSTPVALGRQDKIIGLHSCYQVALIPKPLLESSRADDTWQLAVNHNTLDPSIHPSSIHHPSTNPSIHNQTGL
jgi:hypothetical protein